MKVLVRNQSGEPLLCCWDDCGQWGDNRHAITYGPKKVIYIFCTERHRELWANSHRSNGNLPTGSKGDPGVIIR